MRSFEINEKTIIVEMNILLLFMQIFAFDEKLVRWWPSLREICVTDSSTDFKKISWVYRLLGRTLRGNGKVVELLKPDAERMTAKITVENRGDFWSKVWWVLEFLSENKTRLTFKAQVEIPDSILVKIADTFGLIQSALDGDRDGLLHNIQHTN